MASSYAPSVRWVSARPSQSHLPVHPSARGFHHLPVLRVGVGRPAQCGQGCGRLVAGGNPLRQGWIRVGRGQQLRHRVLQLGLGRRIGAGRLHEGLGRLRRARFPLVVRRGGRRFGRRHHCSVDDGHGRRQELAGAGDPPLLPTVPASGRHGRGRDEPSRHDQGPPPPARDVLEQRDPPGERVFLQMMAFLSSHAVRTRALSECSKCATASSTAVGEAARPVLGYAVPPPLRPGRRKAVRPSSDATSLREVQLPTRRTFLATAGAALAGVASRGPRPPPRAGAADRAAAPRGRCERRRSGHADRPGDRRDGTVRQPRIRPGSAAELRTPARTSSGAARSTRLPSPPCRARLPATPPPLRVLSARSRWPGTTAGTSRRGARPVCRRHASGGATTCRTIRRSRRPSTI